MKIVVRCGVVFVALCCVASTTNAQVVSHGPQPDDDPVVEQSTDQLLSQFDENAEHQIDEQELRGVLKLLILEIRDLRREVQSLKQQCELLQSQPPNLHITRKPVLPLPADGGVYGGKYYPPSQSQSINK